MNLTRVAAVCALVLVSNTAFAAKKSAEKSTDKSSDASGAHHGHAAKGGKKHAKAHHKHAKAKAAEAAKAADDKSSEPQP